MLVLASPLSNQNAPLNTQSAASMTRLTVTTDTSVLECQDQPKTRQRDNQPLVGNKLDTPTGSWQQKQSLHTARAPATDKQQSNQPLRGRLD